MLWKISFLMKNLFELVFKMNHDIWRDLPCLWNTIWLILTGPSMPTQQDLMRH